MRLIKNLLLIALLFFPFLPKFPTVQSQELCQKLEYRIFPDATLENQVFKASFEFDFNLQFNNPNNVNYDLGLVTYRLTPTILSAELVNKNYTVIPGGPVIQALSNWEFTPGISTISLTRGIGFIDIRNITADPFPDGSLLPDGNYTLAYYYSDSVPGYPLTFRSKFGNITATIPTPAWDYERQGDVSTVRSHEGSLRCATTSSTSLSSSSFVSKSSSSTNSTNMVGTFLIVAIISLSSFIILGFLVIVLFKKHRKKGREKFSQF